MNQCIRLFLLIAFSLLLNGQAPTALDKYVAAADPNYKYTLVNSVEGDGFTTHVLDMTSQSWRSASEVDRTLWRHWITIVVPKTVSGGVGFLFITGGANNGSPAPKIDLAFVAMAMETKSVVAELRMVPNQPLTFAGETAGRTEDSFIAYTWDKFLKGGDDQWPARLPMTKSAVRAMDAITSFCGGEPGGRVKVDRYVVSGASKRGWTTWTTAAVDKRVVAIIPLVIDLLNVEKSFDHHWRAYGFWAPSIGDYQRMDIMRWTGTPRYHELMKIEEPYEYRDRLTMPKYMINAAGDQFFLPDSSQFYFADLKGEKYLRYVPNTDHSLRGTDVRESLSAFYQAFLLDKPRPKFTWTFGEDGSIRVKTDTKPLEVKLWQATNPEARDFRLEKIGPAYKSSPVNGNDEGLFVASVEKPAKGWTAYLVELTFAGPGKYPFKFTTDVRVLPDVLPFPSRQDETKNGSK